MNQEKIGKFIKECRLKKNLSQTDLADKLGITNKAISKWENGRCMPDISLLEPLSNILGVSINELIKGETIEKMNMEIADDNINKALRYYEKSKRRALVLKIMILTFIVIIARFLIIIAAIMVSSVNAKIEVVNDISLYSEVIGDSASKKYKDKMGMNEEIFPKDLNSLSVLDFKFVYYNPWDPQYLSYLVIDYSEDEVNRLEAIGTQEYLNYYGVTGFNEEYRLLAMESDEYYGFIYALTDGEKIIYVELLFCNYFFDIDYESYINKEYLPIGFDAKINNSYRKKMLKE